MKNSNKRGGEYHAIKKDNRLALVRVPNKKMLISAVIAGLADYVEGNFGSLPAFIEDVSCELDWSDLPDSRRIEIENAVINTFHKLRYPEEK